MSEPGNVEQERLRESQKSHISLGRPVKGRKSTPNAEPRLVGTATLPMRVAFAKIYGP